MSAIASQITSVSIVCSAVCSGADQRNQRSAELACVREIHKWPVAPLTKSQKRGKSFHLMTTSWHLVTGNGLYSHIICNVWLFKRMVIYHNDNPLEGCFIHFFRNLWIHIDKFPLRLLSVPSSVSRQVSYEWSPQEWYVILSMYFSMCSTVACNIDKRFW